MGSKVNILTPGSGEENCNFYCRCQTRSIGSYCSKDLSSLMDFRERFMWVRGFVQLANCLLIGWWWGNQESASSTSWFQPVWDVIALGSIQLTSSTWWVFKYLLTKKKKKQETSKDLAHNIIYSFWGRTNCPWLLFCLVWLFPLCVHFFYFSD